MRENSKSYAAVSNNLTRQIIEEFIESKGTFSYETILRTSITKSQRCTFKELRMNAIVVFCDERDPPVDRWELIGYF